MDLDSLCEYFDRHDERELTRLYEEYGDRLYYFILGKVKGRGDPEDAADLAQSIWLEVLNICLEKPGFCVSFPLVRVIAQRRIIDHFRKEKNKGLNHFELPAEDGITDTKWDISWDIALSIEEEELERTIKEQLTELQQRIFDDWRAGYNNHEMAERLKQYNVNVNIVAQNKSRIKKIILAVCQ